MAFKFLLIAACACLISTASAGVVPVAYAASGEYDPLPQYSYGYDVQDALTGDSKNQFEVRNGDIVQGSYSLTDPDGTRRTVDYVADPINGFNAAVRKEPLVAPVVAAAPAVAVARAAPVVAAAPAVAVARAAPVVAAAPAVAVARAAPFVAAAPAVRAVAAPLAYSAAPVAYSAAPVAYSAGPVAYSTGPVAYSAPFAYPAAAPFGRIAYAV